MLYFKTISPVTGHISVSLSSKEYAAAGFALAEVFAACASCDSCDFSAVSVPCASLPVVIFSVRYATSASLFTQTGSTSAWSLRFSAPTTMGDIPPPNFTVTRGLPENCFKASIM